MKKKPKKKEPASPPPASITRRQYVIEMLENREMTFDEIRRVLEISEKDLEEDLRHIQQSLRHGEEEPKKLKKLKITPAQCVSCGFIFRGREIRHLHAPSRCPECRSERIDEPSFCIE